MAESQVATGTRVAAGEELADRHREFRDVQHPVAVLVEPGEGPFGLVGVGPVDRRQPGVLPGVEHPVGVGVGRLDQAAGGGADGGVESRAVRDIKTHGGDELVPGDRAVPVGVHVRQHRVEQGPLARGHRASSRGIGGMAEGLAQPPDQQLAVVPLPQAVPVGVDDSKAALQRGPLTGTGRPPAGDRPGQDHGQQHRRDHQDRQPGRDFRRPAHPGAVQCAQQQLHPDEGADEAEAGVQVGDPAQHPGHQRVHLAQPHQCERVAGHHQHGVGGDAEHGRDRIEGEQQVGQPDRRRQQEHRRRPRHPPGPPPEPGRQPGVPLGLSVRPGPAPRHQPGRGPQQDPGERVEEPPETVQRGRPGHDDERPQDQRQPDPEQQDAGLAGCRDREPGHDHGEDEQVVQAQAVLGEVSGVELARRHPAGGDPQGQPEQPGQRHVDPDPADRRAGRKRSLAQCGLGPDNRGQSRRRHRPDPHRDGHRSRLTTRSLAGGRRP